MKLEVHVCPYRTAVVVGLLNWNKATFPVAFAVPETAIGVHTTPFAVKGAPHVAVMPASKYAVVPVAHTPAEPPTPVVFGNEFVRASKLATPKSVTQF